VDVLCPQAVHQLDHHRAIGASRRGTRLSITYAIPRVEALRMWKYTRPRSVAPCAKYAVRA